MNAFRIVEFYSGYQEYHSTGPSGLFVNVMQVSPAGQGYTGSDGLKRFDALACVHADTESGKVLRSRSTTHQTADVGGRCLKIGVILIQKSLCSFTAQSGEFYGLGRIDFEWTFIKIMVQIFFP